MCFGTAAFDTDTFQCEILYQKEGHLILYPVIRLCCVQGGIDLRVMIDFVRDPTKFQILAFC